jgi:hypothetical protein
MNLKSILVNKNKILILITGLNTALLILGTSDLPRFSCACHKLNLSIRHALKSSPTLNDIIKAISQCRATVRKSIKLSKVKEIFVYEQNF